MHVIGRIVTPALFLLAAGPAPAEEADRAGSTAPDAAARFADIAETAPPPGGSSWISEDPWKATKISILCGAAGAEPARFALRAIVEARVTFKHVAEDRGERVEFERYNVVHAIQGNFEISGSESPPRVETVFVTGASGVSKYLAHGTSFHLVGIAADGRTLDLAGNIFYDVPLRITWDDLRVSERCTVDFGR